MEIKTISDRYETESNSSTSTSTPSDEEEALLHTLQIPLPSDEKKRLQFLRETNILDSDTKEESYDVFTSFIGRKFKVPIAVIGMIDVNSIFIKSRLDWSLDERMTREMSFTAFTILDDAPPLVIYPDLAKETRFKDCFIVNGPAHLRFYAGASILCEGNKIGSICIFDIKPRPDLTHEVLSIIPEFALMIADLMIERRKRYLYIQQEQIKYLIGITNNLKIPKDKARLQFQEMLCLKKKWETMKNLKTSQSQEVINRMSELIHGFHHHIDSMAQQLETILKLAHVSFEVKNRPVNIMNQTLEEVVLNQYLHKDSHREQLIYHSMPSIMSILQNNLNIFPCMSTTSTSPEFISLSRKFSWKFKDQNKHSDKLYAIDLDLMSLILHAILKPYSYLMNEENISNPWKYSLQCSIIDVADTLIENSFHITSTSTKMKGVHEKNIESQLPSFTNSISASLLPYTNKATLKKQLKQFVIDIVPSLPQSESNVYYDSMEFDLNKSEDFVRSPSLHSLSETNLVEYSEQTMLKDILRSTYGDIDIYFPISSAMKCSDDQVKPLAYRIHILCATKEGAEPSFNHPKQMHQTSLYSHRSLQEIIPFNYKRTEEVERDLPSSSTGLRSPATTKDGRSKSWDVWKDMPSLLLPLFSLGLSKNRMNSYTPNNRNNTNR